MRVGILGGGAFGAALGLMCHARGYGVRVWTNEVDLPDWIREEKESAMYLPAVAIPDAMEFAHDLASLRDGARAREDQFADSIKAEEAYVLAESAIRMLTHREPKDELTGIG